MLPTGTIGATSIEVYFDCGTARRVEGGGEAYSFVACLSHLTIDHASRSRHVGGKAWSDGGYVAGGKPSRYGTVARTKCSVRRFTFHNSHFTLQYNCSQGIIDVLLAC